MNKKDAEQLNRYIEEPEHNPAPDRQTAQVVARLQQQAQQVEPRPQFVQELSGRLQAEAQQQKAPRSLADWLVLRFVPRLAGATAVVGLLVLLAWGLPQLWQRWANPEVEPVISGEAIPVSERVATDAAETFPEVPAQLPLYHIEFEPVPTTPETAVAWAADFGIPDPQAFTAPRMQDMMQVIGSNQETLLFQTHGVGLVYYYSTATGAFGRLEASMMDVEPLPFAEAAAIAVNFLAERNRLPEAYRIIESAEASQTPARAVSIVPELAGGYQMASHNSGPVLGPGIKLFIGPEGDIWHGYFNFGHVTAGEVVDIIPAREAYEAYQAGALQSFSMETTRGETNIPSVRHFTPPPPEYQVGDVVEVKGWPNVLVPANGGEIQVTLHGDIATQGVYHLNGEKVEELAAAEMLGDVLVRGVVTAVGRTGEWQLSVSDWEAGRPAYSSYMPFTCLQGVFSREIDGERLAADDGAHYVLPQAPAELNDGERIEVCSETTPADGAAITWLSISQPPAPEAPRAEGGVSVTSVEVPTVVERVESISEDGGITVERSVISGGGGGGGGQMGSPAAGMPYELGETLTLTGTIQALIFEEKEGGERYQVQLQLLNEVGLVGGSLPLKAAPEVLEEIAQYHDRFLSVSGVIVATADGYGQEIEVQTFTAVWPEAGAQNFLGHIELETVEGVDTAVFIDHATDQRYLIAYEQVYYGEGDPQVSQPQLLVTGIVHPELEAAGLPVLIMRGSRYDGFITQAEDVSEFPLEEGPQRIPYHPFSDPSGLTDMILERMELVYYWQPAYDSGRLAGSPGIPPLLPEQTAQPGWLIYGRSPDGSTSYKIYVGATRQ